MTFKKYGIGLAVAAALGVAGSAQAVMIDDMNFTAIPANGQAVDPPGGVNGPVGPDSRGTGGSGAWVVGGNRTGQLYVNQVIGDPGMGTQDCPNCKVGHAVTPSSSFGHHYWLWQGPDLNVDSVSFDYETDIANGDFFITLFDNGGQVAQQQWSDLVATGLTAFPPPLTLAQPLTIAYSGVIDEIRIDLISAGNADGYTDPTGVLNGGGALDLGIRAVGLDANIDNLRYGVPEPTTLAMLGLGLAGLGWQRRRKSA